MENMKGCWWLKAWPRCALPALLCATMACGLAGVPPTAMPALKTITRRPGEAARPAETEPARRTQTYRTTATAAAASTLAAAALQATEQAQQTAQAATSTQAVRAAATQRAGSMAEVIQQLYAQGDLSTDQGRYFQIPDFVESWAQLNYYFFWDTEYAPADFVVRADTHWESASNTADWWNTGCGFVYREQDVDNHYLIFLALDGFVYHSAFRRGEYIFLGSKYYGRVDVPIGQAQVMLVVEGDKTLYYVDGQLAYVSRNAYFDSGLLALTLVSGTNKDFGTRCQITNIELWQIR